MTATVAQPNRQFETNITRELLAAEAPRAILLEPPAYDQAIVGVMVRDGVACAVYDASQLVDLIAVDQDWSYEDALEWFGANIEDANMGSGTPFFMMTCMDPGALAWMNDLDEAENH